MTSQASLQHILCWREDTRLNCFIRRLKRQGLSISDRLLSFFKPCISSGRHYRCDKKIIGFNNRKYYNSQLKICSERREKNPLQYIDVDGSCCYHKNTSPEEVEEIVRFASFNRNKSIGVITPFVNQKSAIEQRLKEEGLNQVSCGTVHAFQGDEKDVILFSTALTDQTYDGTYQWLKNNRELINVAVSRAKEQLIRVENSYARRYQHIKEILSSYFSAQRR